MRGGPILCWRCGKAHPDPVNELDYEWRVLAPIYLFGLMAFLMFKWSVT